MIQATILEDLIDEFLLYLVDPRRQQLFALEVLNQLRAGRNVELLRSALADCGLDAATAPVLDDLRDVLQRRNTLAHSPLIVRPKNVVPIGEMPELEFVIRRRTKRGPVDEVVTEDGLRDDLRATVGVFSALLRFAEVMTERAPLRTYYVGGPYLAAPHPDVR